MNITVHGTKAIQKRSDRDTSASNNKIYIFFDQLIETELCNWNEIFQTISILFMIFLSFLASKMESIIVLFHN